MCTFLFQNGVLWVTGQMHCEICDIVSLYVCHGAHRPMVNKIGKSLTHSLKTNHDKKYNKKACIFNEAHITVTWAGYVNHDRSGGRFKNTYELLNLRTLKFSYVNKINIVQCMGKIFCVEFQRYPLKFPTKYLTHTLKDMILYNIEILRALRFKSSCAFLKRPPYHHYENNMRHYYRVKHHGMSYT